MLEVQISLGSYYLAYWLMLAGCPGQPRVHEKESADGKHQHEWAYEQTDIQMQVANPSGQPLAPLGF